MSEQFSKQFPLRFPTKAGFNDVSPWLKPVHEKKKRTRCRWRLLLANLRIFLSIFDMVKNPHVSFQVLWGGGAPCDGCDNDFELPKIASFEEHSVIQGQDLLIKNIIFGLIVLKEDLELFIKA